MIRKLNIILLLLSSTILAEESKLEYLPKENLDFEIIDSQTVKPLVKDEFETTAEFEKRKLNQRSSSEAFTLYKESSLRYDADSETYSFSCYISDKITLKDNTTYISKSGKNGFGTTWEWKERVGEKYEIIYQCPKGTLNQVQVPIEDAKRFRNDLIAVLQIKLEPQNWSSGREFDTPEFGKSFVNNYKVFQKEGAVEAVHYGLKDNRSIYFSKYDRSIDGLSTTARIEPIVRIEPKYPIQAARDGKEGWVELAFIINELGGVEDVDVINAEPKRVFDREAKRALRKWKYKPLVENGKPVKQYNMTVRLDFTLNKN